MARSIDSDPYLNFRFHLVDPQGGNLDPVAGFTKVEVPTLEVGIAEYREGVDKFTKKFPGIPKISDITLEKGIFKKESDFMLWMNKSINGGETYRSDLVIQEYHMNDELGISGSPSRLILIKEVFSASFVPSTAKNSNEGTVAMQSLKLAIEEFEIKVIES